MWIEPIIDRTIEDVIYHNQIVNKILTYGYDSLTVEEKEYWESTGYSYLNSTTSFLFSSNGSRLVSLSKTQGSKGTLKADDLKRIEYNTKYLSDMLNQCGYTNTVTVKTDWLESEFSTVEEIDRIKSNLIELVTVFSNYITNPTLELQSIYMSYSNLNDIEQILFNTNLILELMIDGFRYSGTFYHCGTDFEL